MATKKTKSLTEITDDASTVYTNGKIATDGPHNPYAWTATGISPTGSFIPQSLFHLQGIEGMDEPIFRIDQPETKGGQTILEIDPRGQFEINNYANNEAMWIKQARKPNRNVLELSFNGYSDDWNDDIYHATTVSGEFITMSCSTTGSYSGDCLYASLGGANNGMTGNFIVFNYYDPIGKFTGNLIKFSNQNRVIHNVDYNGYMSIYPDGTEFGGAISSVIEIDHSVGSYAGSVFYADMGQDAANFTGNFIKFINNNYPLNANVFNMDSNGTIISESSGDSFTAKDANKEGEAGFTAYTTGNMGNAFEATWAEGTYFAVDAGTGNITTTGDITAKNGTLTTLAVGPSASIDAIGNTVIGGDLDVSGHTNVQAVHFQPGTVSDDQAGELYWDENNATLALVTGLGNTVQIGQETWGVGKNATGGTVYDGNVVFMSGATGGIPFFHLGDATGPATSANTHLGVVTASISADAIGPVTTFGVVNDVDTSDYTEGEFLYLRTNPTSTNHLSGSMTTIKPDYPDHVVLVATVLKTDATSGQIFVNPKHDPHGWINHVIDSRAYGGLSIEGNTNTMIASAGDWSHIHDFSEISPYTNTTPVSAEGSIFVGLDGDYMVSCPLSVLNGAQADDFLFRVFVDDVGIPSLTFSRTFGGSDVGSGMISGIVALTAGQEVDLRAQAAGADRTITVTWANLTVNRLSIT